MKCPTCTDTTLAMAVRESIEVDYCPQCRGVWLDRGELDKLIERAATPAPGHASAAPSHPGFVDSDFVGSAGQHTRRKRSWLGDIFD